MLNLTFTFQLQGGGTVQSFFSVGPSSRFSLFANQVLPNQAFSTRIDGDQPFFAERSMFVSYEGDDVPQIAAPATVWLFAEGATVQPFHTWLLLQNPNAQTATATITYLLEVGGTRTQVLGLPPMSRTSIFVNEVLPNAAFSTQVRSDQPIIVERAEYRFPGNAAMADAGVQNPSATWFFAEGSTRVNPFGLTLPMDTWLLIQNPNNGTVSAAITLFDTQGRTFTTTQFIPPLSRKSLFLNQFTTLQSFGIQVNASSPVVVERSNFLNIEPKGAMLTFGTPTLNTIWNFPEGSTAPPFEEVIAVLNPHSQDMGVSMKFFLQGGQTVVQQFVVPPRTKLSVTVDSIILNAANSAQVVSTLPSVAERTMYFDKPGGIGGSNKVGIPGG